MPATPLINVADVQLLPPPPALAPKGEAAQKYQARMGQIAPLLGAKQLGCNVTAIAPGKSAFPFHCHSVNEELFYILEGSGQLRFGRETFPVRAGDVVICPAGGPEVAHQFINSGSTELKVLGISTKQAAEVAFYPDSGKFGVLANGGAFRFVGRADLAVDYWQGN